MVYYDSKELVIYDTVIMKPIKSLNLCLNAFKIEGAQFLDDQTIICIMNSTKNSKNYCGLFHLAGDEISPQEIEYISNSPLTQIKTFPSKEYSVVAISDGSISLINN